MSEELSIMQKILTKICSGLFSDSFFARFFLPHFRIHQFQWLQSFQFQGLSMKNHADGKIVQFTNWIKFFSRFPQKATIKLQAKKIHQFLLQKPARNKLQTKLADFTILPFQTHPPTTPVGADLLLWVSLRNLPNPGY